MREVVKCLALTFCSVLLVLFVPSSAWADDIEPPPSSASPSPSDGSSTPPPATVPEPEPEPSSSQPVEPDPSSPSPTPVPTVTETVTPSPAPQVQDGPNCSRADPCVFEPTRNYMSFAVLTGGVSLMALLGLLARSFGPR